jgi:hypothetical protein
MIDAGQSEGNRYRLVSEDGGMLLREGGVAEVACGASLPTVPRLVGVSRPARWVPEVELPRVQVLVFDPGAGWTRVVDEICLPDYLNWVDGDNTAVAVARSFVRTHMVSPVLSKVDGDHLELAGETRDGRHVRCRLFRFDSREKFN